MSSERTPYCVFCEIIAGREPADVLHQDDEYIVFRNRLRWLPVMLLTKPESDETLDSFYARVRPAGSGWARQRSRVGLEPDSPLRRDLLRTLWAAFVLFG